MSAQSTASPVVYKDVPGFTGYRVGDDGSVWTNRMPVHLKGIRGIRYIEGDIWRRMKPSRSKRTGYLALQLSGRSWTGGRTKFNVHTLVLSAFVGPCPDGLEACHKDGDRGNNAASNLRWDTHASNAADMLQHGTRVFGERCHNAKLTDEVVRQVRADFADGATRKNLATRHGISFRRICNIVNRETWRHVK